MSGISVLFQPLEDAIRGVLIPSIIGREVSNMERRTIALSMRYGGLGICDPVLTCDHQCTASVEITSNLTRLILNQEDNLAGFDPNQMKHTITQLKQVKELHIKDEYQSLLEECDPSMRRAIELAAEKGSCSWLSCLPIQSLGYTLNKQEFRDALCVRYNWKISKMPSHYACGQKTDMDHTLVCKKGGYVIMRHNAVRDVEAELLREVCRDVKVEPELLPVNQDGHNSTNNACKARLDVSAVGLWSPFERSYVDTRMFHPNTLCHASKNLTKLYREQENEKKRLYNDRVLNVDRGTFIPLVFSTSGGMERENLAYHKRLAQLIATSLAL